MATLFELAGQEGFEPSTIRLTAERTTTVLLTQKRKKPRISEASFKSTVTIRRICSVRVEISRCYSASKLLFLPISISVEIFAYLVTLESIKSASDSSLWHSVIRSS